MTSRLLGAFLGAVGVHNFYIKENKKGVIFLSMFALSFITMIVSLTYELSVLMRYNVLRTNLNWGLILAIVSTVICVIVVIAGIIDGVLSYKRTQEKNFDNILAVIRRA